MRGNFENCLAVTLLYEGGRADHPSDPGGRTNLGVTQAVYDSWRKRRGKPLQSVFYIDRAEADAIYQSQYWVPVRGDDWPLGLDLCTFDAGVNSGPSRGIKWSQKAIAPDPDGHVGLQTIATANALRGSRLLAAIKAACANRSGFVSGLSTFRVFGRGWTARIAGVEAKALRMAGTPADLREAQTEAEKSASSAKKTGQGASGAAVGTGTPATLPVDSSLKWWLIAAAISAAVVVGLSLYKNRIHKARARAFAAEAQRT